MKVTLRPRREVVTAGSGSGAKPRTFRPMTTPRRGESQRQGSLLAHIPFHYVPQRWQYLERVLAALGEYKLERVVAVVDSNTSDVCALVEGLSLPGHIDVRVDVHENLAHPFGLTWAHRKNMARSLESFDTFMYLEDDIHVPWKTFEAWLRRQDVVGRRGYIQGFLRVESDVAGRAVSTDWRRPLRRPRVIQIGEARYVRPEAFYQACWVYARSVMQRFVATDAWVRGFHRWSSVTRGHRNLGDANYAREFSAFGMACATPGRPRVLLPVDAHGQIARDAWVWHLPNNYAQGSGVQLLGADGLITDGLRAPQKPADAMDLVLEGGRWAAHLLRLDDAAHSVRRRIRQLLR